MIKHLLTSMEPTVYKEVKISIPYPGAGSSSPEIE